MKSDAADPLAASTAGEFLGAWLKSPLLDGAERITFNKYYASYARLWDRYIEAHYSRQLKRLMELANSAETFRLLDLGCGCGMEALWVAYRTGASVVGQDLRADRLRTAARCLETMRERSGRPIQVEFRRGNLFETTEKESFDAVWMQQTFHHLEPRAEAVEKIASLIKPGGYAAASEPNAWNPLIQLNFFRQRGFRTIKTYTDENGVQHPYGNERILTPLRLSRAFARCGVLKRRVEYFRALPNAAWARRFERLERRLPSWAAPFFTHYTYIGQKR